MKKNVPIKGLVAALKSLGLVPKSETASHQKWDFPVGKKQLDRPVILRPGKDKEVPLEHYRTIRQTLYLSGIISPKEFDNLIDKMS